ncbi:MAG: DUF2799 domain-containing protein [Chromatiales bacterium]|nr:MAG: DUF2799 domain-containing protein [Chromatiales bacterium]
MDYRKILGLAVMVMVVQGCASMSGQECMVADWQAIGYEDGVRGSTADRIGNHRKACAKHGIAPDLKAYQTGREAGLREFCQPENGYNLGVRGASYSGVCPADLDVDFYAAYSDGKRLYSLRSSVSQVETQIRSKERRLNDIEDEVTQAGVRMISEESTPEERVALLTKTKHLAEEYGTLEEELDNLRIERAKRRQELSEYEATQARL